MVCVSSPVTPKGRGLHTPCDWLQVKGRCKMLQVQNRSGATFLHTRVAYQLSAASRSSMYTRLRTDGIHKRTSMCHLLLQISHFFLPDQMPHTIRWEASKHTSYPQPFYWNTSYIQELIYFPGLFFGGSMIPLDMRSCTIFAGKNAKLWALQGKDAWGVLPRTRTHSWPMLAVNYLCFDALRSVPIPFFTNNQMACFEHVRDIEAENDICFVWPISEICFLYGPFLIHFWNLLGIWYTSGHQTSLADLPFSTARTNTFMVPFHPLPVGTAFCLNLTLPQSLRCRPPQRLNLYTPALQSYLSTIRLTEHISTLPAPAKTSSVSAGPLCE